MTIDVLSRRALNRATLERQLLLERSQRTALDVIEHLVGLQAQIPANPYLGLWSRLDRFQAEELANLLVERAVVRVVVMRATIHLVTAADCLRLRPLMQPVLDGELTRHRDVAPAIRGLDLQPILEFAASLLSERPHTGPQLRAALAERYPDLDAAALAYACRNLLVLVQVPPRGVWGKTAAVTYATAESWLGRPVERRPSIDDVALRYFAAFGPATVTDLASWSRLTGMREVVDRLGPRLRAFRDEDGRTLFDLPDAPRPDPDVRAPIRFLPEYDNVVLSHADRSRFTAEAPRVELVEPAPTVRGAILADGALVGTWRFDDTAEDLSVVVDPVVRLTKRATTAISAEGRRMLRFLATDPNQRSGPGEVRFAPIR